MNNVILQPAGDRAYSRPHYVNTVQNAVPMADIAKHVSSNELAYITASITADSICAWGIRPGLGEAQWKKIQPGDMVLFAWDNHYQSSSTVVAKIHNTSLATQLWDTDAEGNTWEWMYFLQPAIVINVPYSQLNASVGYKPNYIPQGVNVLQGEKAEAAFEVVLGASPSTVIDNVTQGVDEIENLDAISTAIVRREQGMLRKQLLGNASTGKCGICGKDYPVKFLVAAHIKKRAECSDAEKADLPSIAMPMCLMGCDALYERGYVTVSNGQVQTASVAHLGLATLLQGLSGNTCSYWNSNNATYFGWHKRNTFGN